MNLLIRPAQYGDIPRLCDLLSELFTIESDFSPDRTKQARGLNLLLSSVFGTSVVLVAENNRRIIGMCSAQIVVSTAQGGPAGLIEDLVVQKEFRGNGIGTRLISEIFKWCKEKDVSRLQLLRDSCNPRAGAFYAGNGWLDTNLVCMRKFL